MSLHSLSVSRPALAPIVLAAAMSLGAGAAEAHKAEFEMVRSKNAAAAGCLANARADVRIRSLGAVEVMDVHVEGLPPNTEYDLFVLQQPDFPFGLAWYQGDIETNKWGKGHERFVGRFNAETFTVSLGAIEAPVIHHEAIPDAALGVATGPVHQYHLGLWFNSPADAAKAGCGSGVTPFNGEHNAGVQILSTRNFPPLEGPLLAYRDRILEWPLMQEWTAGALEEPEEMIELEVEF